MILGNIINFIRSVWWSNGFVFLVMQIKVINNWAKVIIKSLSSFFVHLFHCRDIFHGQSQNNFKHQIHVRFFCGLGSMKYVLILLLRSRWICPITDKCCSRWQPFDERNRFLHYWINSKPTVSRLIGDINYTLVKNKSFLFVVYHGRVNCYVCGVPIS